MITGASSGIGRTLSFWYLNNGARVALVGRDLGELEKIGRLFPAQALVVKCDLTIDINMFHMNQSIQEKFGRCDILINCAGKSSILVDLTTMRGAKIISAMHRARRDLV